MLAIPAPLPAVTLVSAITSGAAPAPLVSARAVSELPSRSIVDPSPTNASVARLASALASRLLTAAPSEPLPPVTLLWACAVASVASRSTAPAVRAVLSPR